MKIVIPNKITVIPGLVPGIHALPAVKSLQILILLTLTVTLTLLLDYAFPPDLSRLSSLSTAVLDRNGQIVAVLPAPAGTWRLRTTTSDVPAAFIDLLIATEDRRFWFHPGVDPISLARAALQWLRAGRVVSGGSTLTMQVARLLQPRPRTLQSKLIECLRALQLQAHFTHREILGMWLTLAPFGGNLEGVRAASLAWFGRPPQALDATQSALLIAIPRRPETLRPDRHPDRARAIRDRILGYAAAAEIPRQRIPMPRHAPQILAALPRSPIITTTLDLPLQTALERLAADRISSLPDHTSLALLIADLATRQIRALTAGAPGDESRAGAIDLTRAIRSPGSALKPFIYAMAFADGIAGPQTRLDDLPRRFGAYAPEDFDRGFAGQVTATTALRRSLNLPAVALLDRVGPLRYAATLLSAGVPLHLPPGADPSLPLALGGAGTTLRDAASLYAALATDGQIAPLQLTPTTLSLIPFLPPRAAQDVADILTQPFPAGGPDGIAWKTGTSWGGRDAWALGFDRQHVAAVWVGRPDGTPMPEATGARLALPLLSHLFEMLPPAPRAHPPPVPLEKSALAPSNSLRLLFPPANAVLSADGPITVRVMGGQRPMTFLVDGQPLPTEPVRREATWTPPSPGFYRLTILDAAGAALQIHIRIK